MDLISPNLKLPYLVPAQAQKHVTHNEALRQLDTILQLSVISAVNTPPETVQDGVGFIVAAAPQDIFEGKENYIAAYQDGAWVFLAPKAGWRSYVQDVSEFRIFNGTAWQILSGGGTAEIIPKLGINTNAGETNRLTVKSPATLLDHENGDHQLKINKATESDTASLVFQTGYNGYAEMGLAGDNAFHIKTSPDGTVFRDSVIVNPQTGSLKTPHGVNPGVMTPPTSACGGPDFFYGLPSVSTILTGRSNLPLVANRLIFTAVYVDRDSTLHGGLVSQYGASSTAGAVMRCGLYHLGNPSGNNWNLGELIHDFGTVPADEFGQKTFDLTAPLTLSQGWYAFAFAFAVGVSGVGAGVRYVQSRQPGLGYVQPHDSVAVVDILFGGPTSYMFESNMDQEILHGLSQSLPSNPVSLFRTTNSYAYNIFIPKWAAFR